MMQEISQENQEQKTQTATTDGNQNMDFLIQKKCKEYNIKPEEQTIIINFFKKIENDLPNIHKKELNKYIQNINKAGLQDISTLDERDQEDEKKIIKKHLLENLDSQAGEPLVETFHNKNNEIISVNNEKKLDQETLHLLEKTEKNYQGLLKEKPNLQPNQNQINEQKSLLEKDGTLEKLKHQGFNDDQINNFASYNYIYTNHQEEIKDTEFSKSYQELCDKILPKDTPINNYVLQKEADKAIKNDENLTTFKENINVENKYRSNEDSINKLTSEEQINEAFQKDKHQELYKKYKGLLEKELQDEENLNPEQKKQAMLMVNKIETTKQELLQKRILGGAISGLSSFFDFSTQQESIEKDLLGKYTIEDNNLVMEGKLKGDSINILYNLGDGKLSMEDYLFQEKNQNLIELGDKKFQDLKIQLPSIEFLKNHALEYSKQKEIKETSIEEYYQSLEKEIHNELMSDFQGNKEIVKIRLEKNIQKNTAAQSIIKEINDIITPTGENIFGKNFNKNEKEKLFTITQILDNSLETYSIGEIEALRKHMPIFTQSIQESIQPKETNHEIKKIFKKTFNKTNNMNKTENEEKSTENLLKIIESLTETKNTKKIININNLKKLTNELESATPDINKLPEETQKIFEGDPLTELYEKRPPNR